MKTYITPKFSSEKKLYIASLFTEIGVKVRVWGCLIAILPIYDRIVSILLDAVTLELLFG